MWSTDPSHLSCKPYTNLTRVRWPADWPARLLRACCPTSWQAHAGLRQLSCLCHWLLLRFENLPMRQGIGQAQPGSSSSCYSGICCCSDCLTARPCLWLDLLGRDSAWLPGTQLTQNQIEAQVDRPLPGTELPKLFDQEDKGSRARSSCPVMALLFQHQTWMSSLGSGRPLMSSSSGNMKGEAADATLGLVLWAQKVFLTSEFIQTNKVLFTNTHTSFIDFQWR